MVGHIALSSMWL